MGCYPLFACQDWSVLPSDIETESGAWVSLTLVSDPLAPVGQAELAQCFDDVRPFKEHLVVDLGQAAVQRTSRHHRYYARRALRHGITIERCDEPEPLASEFAELYEVLVARHGIVGVKRFSRESLRAQLSVPGAVMFRARRDGETLSAHVWYAHGDAAYSHLSATSEEGYAACASYALCAGALDWLAGESTVAVLGAAAGEGSDDDDGLAQFKKGWATGTRIAHLCTRIFDHSAYEELAGARAVDDGGYFPRYRAGELISERTQG